MASVKPPKMINMSFYVVFDRLGAKAIRKNKPKLNSYECAVRLNLEVSETFFENNFPEATLKIPEDYVLKPGLEVTLSDPNWLSKTSEENKKEKTQ